MVSNVQQAADYIKDRKRRNWKSSGPAAPSSESLLTKKDATKRQDFAIEKTVQLTVKKKFEAVFVTVAMTDGHFCRDLTNIVHIIALKMNTRLKQKTLRHNATCK